MRYLKQSTSVDLPIGPFLDDTDGKTAETALTLTQPDIRLKKNAAAWAQKNAAQTLSHEENGYYEVTLDATDTNTLGLLRLAVAETGALPIFEDFTVLPADAYDALVSGSGNGIRSNVITMAANVVTASALATDAVQEIRDAILNAALSSFTTAGTLGQRLQVVDSGTAQAGAAASITLRSGASATDDFYNDGVVFITGGTGVGQARAITDYVGSTKVATISPNWITNPDNTSVYAVLPGVSSSISTTVTANVTQWNGTNVATPTVPGVPEVDVTHWVGTAVAAPDTAGYPKATIKAGTGTGELSLASGRVAVTEAQIDQIVDEVWDEARSGHVTAGTFGEYFRSIIRVNTAQAGAAGTITLDTGASATDDFYVNSMIVIVAGTGAGQGRQISDYVGATKVASVNLNWATNPDNTSVFMILPLGINPAASGITAADVWAHATRVLTAGTNIGTVTADVASISGDSAAADALEAALDGTGGVTLSVTLGANSVTASSLGSDAVDEILDEVVEGSTTLRQALRLLLSALAGKVNGAGTTTINFRDLADSKNRITATVDTDGNRTSTTLDAS